MTNSKPLCIASEIRIKLGLSPSFLRLIILLYLFSLGLILYSANYLWVKTICILFSTWVVLPSYKTRTPCPDINELRIKPNSWLLVLSNQLSEEYQNCNILINNPLFHLLKFQNETQSKLLLFFNDQISNTELRYMHIINA